MKNESVPGSSPGSFSYRSVKIGVKPEIPGPLSAFVKDSPLLSDL